MSAEVFISYAAKDRERVLGLVQRLRDAGVTVWIDQAGIDVSTMWSQEIVNLAPNGTMFIHKPIYNTWKNEPEYRELLRKVNLDKL